MQSNHYSSIHYWLVEHPSVSQFEWKQGITFGSTPLFLRRSLLTYLTLTFILHRFQIPTIFRPAMLRFFTAVHSLFLCILSVIMAAGCILSTLHHIKTHGNDWTWAVCFPANRTPPRGPTFFWAQVFYLSKLLEFIDTLLILLSSSRSRRLSFLHVYHHTVVVIMSYLWLSTSQTLFPVGLVTNASVHIVMYAYYMLSALGIRPKWKRFVTNFQIFQFVFGFAISGLMLYYHFTGSGCNGMPGWLFNTIFNGTLLALFLDFHSKNYGKKEA